MPVKKAAIKDLKSSKKKALKNANEKRNIKELLKKAIKAVDDSKLDEVKKISLTYQKAIDKAVKTGWLKKNTGNRKKSRLAKKVKKAVKK
ncbi:30S ribosomal protein S20 [bacterium]|jgi:small subunit ribosomal protein S20|nr:30S ribosomal protein S20 [bacterium]MBT4121329.1 30S ribosomal protein S20 [bacterium]MBT4335713.1 30S ribosomal protein S20 [bacterium]MBT4495722.1 30S ribosomal protein S20 [bacterium]MBT4763598.1 30S ribosomal protein S20 [bacterium]